MKPKLTFRSFALNTVWLWLILFAFIPYALIVIASLLSHSQQSLLTLPFSITSYSQIFNSAYFIIFKKSFYLAGICTFFCLILGYPFAYLLSQVKSHIRNLLMILVIIPFWTSSLIRSYAMIALLKTKGLLNLTLIKLGLIHFPLQLLYTNTAVMIGLIYNLLPFMILPLYANIERLDHRLVDAARDLGANRITTFRKIILPLTFPGILSGAILVFLPAMTLFYIPDLLGGAKSLLLGNLIQDQFLFANNWPLGSAISVILTLIMAIMLWAYWLKAKSTEQKDLL